MPSAAPGVARRKQTQWAAQFSVAGELCKRNYQVSFTMGHNTPLADLSCVSPNGKMFRVDTKRLATPNSWLLTRKASTENLYYILVYVPETEANRYFVLSQEEANALVAADTWSSRQKVGTSAEGFSFKAAFPFENAWHKLPS